MSRTKKLVWKKGLGFVRSRRGHTRKRSGKCYCATCIHDHCINSQKRMPVDEKKQREEV